VGPEFNHLPVPVPSVEQWVRPGRNLRFSDESYDPDGTIVLYQWDFDGDGYFDFASPDDANATHVYPEEGIYVVVLQVTDNRGDVNSTSITVKVNYDAPGDDGVDDAKGAAVCCAATLVILFALVYWTMRKSMATPRKDGGPGAPRPDEGEDEDKGGSEGGGKEEDAQEEPPSDVDRSGDEDMSETEGTD
jgi:PKD repeat protein